MLGVLVPETVVFILVVAVHGAGALVAVFQLLRKSERYRPLLWPFVFTAAFLDALLLGLRAAAIGAVPLTSTFEAFVFLSLVFGVLFLLLSRTIDRVWFGSVIVWIIFGLIVMAAVVAKPAARASADASTPWAIAHATIMVLAAAAVMFATASSVLYLLASYRLKHKAVMQVLGRIPNMETLGDMNRLGLLAGFVLLTMGLASGMGLVSSLGMDIASWVADGKVICLVAVWSLLGAVLVLDRFSMVKEKFRACVTIVAFVLVLLAILGVAVAGITQHQFSLDSLSAAPLSVV